MPYLFAVALLLTLPTRSYSADFGSTLVGAWGTVVMHESGHALTSIILGSEVERFAPYPTKIRYVSEGGAETDKWVLGFIKSKPFEGENAQRNQALVSAMGSGTNLLSVFLLAPLLPYTGSDFARDALDQMLFFSSFDAAAYVTGDLLFQNQFGDWTQVSKLTGVHLGYYLIGAAAAGMIANEYRLQWSRKARSEEETQASKLSLAFSAQF